MTFGTIVVAVQWILRMVLCCALATISHTLVFSLALEASQLVNLRIIILLCLGGRSHEAYSSRVVCVCVTLSVAGIAHRTLKTKR